jgi:hypothetical protein
MLKFKDLFEAKQTDMDRWIQHYKDKIAKYKQEMINADDERKKSLTQSIQVDEKNLKELESKKNKPNAF